MKQIFISSVQKEFERERAAIKKMIETDPLIKPHFKAFVFEIDAPAADKSTRQVYLEELEKCDIYLVLVGDKYGYCKGDEPSPTEQEFDKAQELGLTKLIMVRGTDNSKREPKEARFLEGAKFADLQRLASELSRGLCQSVLRKLRKEGKIRSKGVTSSARWFVGGEETCNKLK